MASENLNKWAKTFSKEKIQLYPLEKCAVYMFQTKDVIHSGPGGNEDMNGRMPIYHVWVNDVEIYCGQNMQHAYWHYRKALQDGLTQTMP